MKNLFKSKKGFTLVELIVVIVIIVILAAALVTSLVGYINKAGNTSALLEAQSVYNAIQAVASEDAVLNPAGSAVTPGTPPTIVSDTIKDKVNNYLGSNVLAVVDLENAAKTADRLYSCTLNNDATIIDFGYQADATRLVTYTTAGGWQVNGEQP